MSETPPFDMPPLIEWLEDNCALYGYKSISKFGDGQSNPTYKITAESGDYVLRAKPPGDLLKSAHAVDREYRVIEALGPTPVPVPYTLALSDNGDASPIGRQFFVMYFNEGRIFWDPTLPEVKTNEERYRIYDAMNDTLAKLHDVDVEKAGLSDFGKPGNYFARQTDRWAKQYRASELERIDAVHELIDWLENNMPEDDGQISIVHGDYRLDNMIFHSDREEVVAVLDWELSTLGHPLADLAYQCMQWRLPHSSGMRGLGGVDRNAMGIPTEGQYLKAYCERRNIGKIDNWSFYVAFSFFKLAAILQGVYRRSVDGNASNPERAKEMYAAVPLLTMTALQEIKDQGS